MKFGKVVILTAGRLAGKKGILVHNNEDGTTVPHKDLTTGQEVLPLSGRGHIEAPEEGEEEHDREDHREEGVKDEGLRQVCQC